MTNEQRYDQGFEAATYDKAKVYWDLLEPILPLLMKADLDAAIARYLVKD